MSALVDLLLLRWWRSNKLSGSHPCCQYQDSIEPSLFQRYSSYHSLTTASGYTYPKIRIFYHPRPHGAKLPKDLPLLVFMHGLGGNSTQFAPLLTSMVNIAPCLAIDLPGNGLSAFKPNDARAYTTAAFAELLCAAIEQYRDSSSNQQVVLVGHSMGCSISALLASTASPLHAELKIDYIIGMVAICPRSSPFSLGEARMISMLKYMPVFIFDLFRLWDSRGGTNSASVTRMVGEGADTETRKLQQKFNSQSKSAVFLRTLSGMAAPANSTLIDFPGQDIWSGIRMPLFLVAAAADTVTSPREVERIAQWLTSRLDDEVPEPPDHVSSQQSINDKRSASSDSQGSVVLLVSSGEVLQAQDRFLSQDANTDNDRHAATAATGNVTVSHQRTKHGFVLKTTVFPAPASHGLLYANATVRVLSGLMETFLATHVDERLSSAWQLRHLTSNDKWDVKNLAKWQKVPQCSEPIAGVFRVMKTMREVDEVHNPREFAKKFGWRSIPDGVAVVIDVSHDPPVYNPNGLIANGIDYHKFPTVSKLPPTPDEVTRFISLVDELRQSSVIRTTNAKGTHPMIGLHCHYGYNRSGAFVVCYMVERMGWKLQDAIDEFAKKRPPGIRHQHFIDELYVRYAVKMEGRGAVVE